MKLDILENSRWPKGSHAVHVVARYNIEYQVELLDRRRGCREYRPKQKAEVEACNANGQSKNKELYICINSTTARTLAVPVPSLDKRGGLMICYHTVSLTGIDDLMFA